MLFNYEIAAALYNRWLPIFIDAALRYTIPVARLLAIASRESNMRNIVGDGGHGYGLMQIDVGTDSTAIEKGLDPYWNIARGAEILDSKRQWILQNMGKMKALTHSTGTVTYIVPIFKEDLIIVDRLAIAMYNCGAWAVYHYSKGRDPDHGTTGKNYSKDVMTREKVFDDWLTKIIEVGIQLNGGEITK